MITKDMKKYRKSYYNKNREYLLSYSKWYYKFCKWEQGEIDFDEVQEKPIKENKHNRKKKLTSAERIIKKEYGNFTVHFE